MVGDTRQGWAVFAAMAILSVPSWRPRCTASKSAIRCIAKLGVDQTASALQSGGNMEGKESRFGIGASALFATVTTGTSRGAVNSMHDSFTPLGGFVPLFNMQLGEVVFGGVGTGLYSMLIFAIVGVFIAGLMIGRTPEYLGKKIEAFEMKMSSIAILVMPFIVLMGTAVAVSVRAGQAGVANPGAHGFSEILYAFTSAGNNNGSAFAGLSANTPFYNIALGLVMWLGRFWPIVAVLAIAGSLAAKKRIPVTAGTMPTHGPTFVVLLIGTVLLVGALTFVPALALGPIVEHLTCGALDMISGIVQQRCSTAPISSPSVEPTAARIGPRRHAPAASAVPSPRAHRRRARSKLSDVRSRPARAGAHRRSAQARPARAMAQPGHVCRLHRQHPDDSAVGAGARRARAKRPPGSS